MIWWLQHRASCTGGKACTTTGSSCRKLTGQNQISVTGTVIDHCRLIQQVARSECRFLLFMYFVYLDCRWTIEMRKSAITKLIFSGFCTRMTVLFRAQTWPLLHYMQLIDKCRGYISDNLTVNNVLASRDNSIANEFSGDTSLAGQITNQENNGVGESLMNKIGLGNDWSSRWRTRLVDFRGSRGHYTSLQRMKTADIQIIFHSVNQLENPTRRPRKSQ